MMTAKERKRVNEIVCGLIVRNMQAGKSYKAAKDAAFNRMKKECPAVLAVWLNRNEK